MKPMTSAKAKAASTASQTGQPNSPMPIATIMPAAPTIEPTLRSNSPAIISSATAEPTMPTCAATSRYVAVPLIVRNPLSPARIGEEDPDEDRPGHRPELRPVEQDAREADGADPLVGGRRARGGHGSASSVREVDRWGRPGGTAPSSVTSGCPPPRGR